VFCRYFPSKGSKELDISVDECMEMYRVCGSSERAAHEVCAHLRSFGVLKLPVYKSYIG